MKPTHNSLTAICHANAIEILYVFGSRADEAYAALYSGGRIDPNLKSDVDIAVKLPATRVLSVRAKAELAMAFEDLLGVCRVDLVLFSEADPFLAVNMIRGNRLFCSDPFLADEYELYILRRAGDLAPFERERIAMVLNR